MPRPTTASLSAPALFSARSWMVLLVVALTSLTTLRETLHRPGTPFGDLAHLFLGAECLLDGCNPYDYAALNHEAAAHLQRTPAVWPQAPVYPPSALLVVLPLAPFGWPAAAIVFNLLAGLLLGLAAVMLVLRFNLGWGPASLLLLTGMVCNPVAAALEFANPSLLVASLATLSALLLLRKHRPSQHRVAWLLLGIALALKPQLVLGLFALLLCIRAARRSALYAMVLGIALLLVASLAYRVRLGSSALFMQLKFNLHRSMLPGSTSDFSPANAESFDFLNLQTILSRLPHLTRNAADSLAWSLTALLAALTVWTAHRRHSLPRRPWTLLALAVLISLLPLYHRGYDRVLALLLVPAAVEISVISSRFAWLYSAAACLWVANDTLMQHWLRRWHYAPQNPLEELILCAILLASLWRSSPRAPLESSGEVGSIAA